MRRGVPAMSGPNHNLSWLALYKETIHPHRFSIRICLSHSRKLTKMTKDPVLQYQDRIIGIGEISTLHHALYRDLFSHVGISQRSHILGHELSGGATIFHLPSLAETTTSQEKSDGSHAEV